MRNVLVLFDIDGTIIPLSKKTRIIHERFSYIVNKTFNINTNIDMIEDNGKTLRGIMIDLSGAGGVKKSKVLKNLPKLYRLEKEYVTKRSSLYHNKPAKGAKALLDALKRQKYPMGLVTGNSEFMSRFKLKRTKLTGYFDFGGFGAFSEHREKLVFFAIKQANKKFRTKFHPKNIFYFGDAPLDIYAGKKAGVTVIAVATGKCSVAED